MFYQTGGCTMGTVKKLVKKSTGNKSLSAASTALKANPTAVGKATSAPAPKAKAKAKVSKPKAPNKRQVLANLILAFPVKGLTLDEVTARITEKTKSETSGSNTDSYMSFAVRLGILRRDGKKYKPIERIQ